MKLKVDYFSKWLLVLIAMAMCNFAIAQRTITGTVTDAENGEPLIGANILVVGTSTGTVTDFDGTYSLNVPEDATELEFSYTGYSMQRVTIGDSDVVNVQLSAGELLEEVVVVGYGTQKAKEVTSAVASVKEEDFNKGNVNNPAQLLQGKVAGLSITRPGGDPTGGFNIRLRGLSTIGENTSPLVVIDGVIGADLNNVDPNDIASIDVLKDGSAAAIYGTRASSGVIIVTTKRGEVGTATIDYNGFVSSESATRKWEVLSADEFRSLPSTADFGTGTNWLDEVTRTAISQTHNLSLSGGNQATTYRFSANYRDQEGVVLNTGFERFNGRLNLSQKALNDRLTVTMNLSGTIQNNDFVVSGQALRQGVIYNPTAPVRVSEGNNPTGIDVGFFDTWNGYFNVDNFDFFNPVSIQEQNVNQGQQKILLGSVRGQYEIVPGLDVAAFYSQERETNLFGTYFSKFERLTGVGRNGLGTRREDARLSELAEATVNWRERIGDSNTEINLLGGYSWQEFTFEGFGATGGNFISDAFEFNNLGASLDFDNGLGDVFSYKNQHRLIAFFGRASINIDDTYFLSATVRREGSSRFGEDEKWGVFPAASAGVTLSNLMNIGAVDNLKFRVGYGVTGAIPGSSYLSLLRFGPQGNFFFNGAFVPSFGPVSNPNPDLKWERKAEINFGLDFAFLDYRLSGTLDVYRRTTNDLLWEAAVPVPPNIFDRKWLNVGELQNQGIELGLNYIAIDDPSFGWETGINFTTFKTELITLSNEEFDFGGERFISSAGAPGLSDVRLIRVKEGEEIGDMWAPVFEGINDDGTWRLADLNGDGTFCDCDEDKTVVGNGLPDFEFGWNNTFTFGNFDLNFFLRGSIGHDLVNMMRLFYEPAGSNLTWNKVKTEYFTDELLDAPKYSSYQVENASFVKLDNATLGYNFDLPGEAAFRKIRVYLNAQNLFVITDYSGPDPEVRYGDPDGGVLAPGIDRRDTYFLPRTITVGANLGF